ncbi:MAG: carbamoyltransferase [Candidatus Aureabacteria bacterium]|nr:carbamoyltransferase [Candidatus Auribacterota bacterium]
MYILGISAFYHDAAAALIKDGDIVAAAQEERFTRIKHDFNFPRRAIEYCLKEAGITMADVEYVGFYDKPLLKFERILETYLAYAPRGISSFLQAIPLWLKQKLHIRETLAKELNFAGKVIFTEHHESHAASAFFPSPFPEAAILTVDGVGEWTTTSYGVGKGNQVQLLGDIHFPHSLGLLYAAFTYYCGFKVNSGEYKLMGLAPYGEPKYSGLILDKLIDLKADGSYKLNLDYFEYPVGLTMVGKKFSDLFGAPPRRPETDLSQHYMDCARSIQDVTEEVLLRMARHLHRETGQKNLCLAGGVALNCVANGRILREGPFEEIWIQPAAGDAGGALGVALFIWYQYLDHPRTADRKRDFQKGSYLGPRFSNERIESFLKEIKADYEFVPTERIPERIAGLIEGGNVIGWFQGRMEFGPRALGARSIIGDARSPEMQSIMNLKIKFRESFRPFAPTVMRDRVSEYFNTDSASPYMLLVADVRSEKRLPQLSAPDFDSRLEEQKRLLIKEMNDLKEVGREADARKIERVMGNAEYLKFRSVIHHPRSSVPAITHINYSARLQTVAREDNALYYDMIKAFAEKTGCPVIINTSFNVRGEPIVCAPEEAWRCFMRTKMDYLIMGNCLLDKKKQKEWKETFDWMKEFQLD